MNKIVEPQKHVIRFSKGDKRGSLVTFYKTTDCTKVEVEDSCGCIWCDLGIPGTDDGHTTRRGTFSCTKQI